MGMKRGMENEKGFMIKDEKGDMLKDENGDMEEMKSRIRGKG